MSAVSNGRVLRIALAGSVAVHLIIAAVVYSHPTVVAAEPPPQHIVLINIKPPRATPTPPPPKHAVSHPQHHTRAVLPATHPPKRIAQAHTDGPPVAPPVEPTGIPGPAQTPGPDVGPTGPPVDVTPAPTPKPACSAPDVAAKTIAAQSPDVPDDERNGFTGTAKVKVDLDATGAVVGTSLYESTGNMQLDQAALRAARDSRYAPEQYECKNVAGSYLFTVDFQ